MSAALPRAWFVVVAALTVATAGLASADDRPAVPKPRDLKEAIAALHDVFEKDYKQAETDASAKKALARKLFDIAPKRKAIALQYVCYDEARKLAASGGDVQLTLDAFAILSTRFRGTPPELTRETLQLLGGGPGLLAHAQDAAASAVEREDYVAALALGHLLIEAARKTQDPDVVLNARKFLARVEALKSAVAAIKSNPDDAAANATLGEYWTFSRGRWDVGLKYLARGSHKELVAAAKQDLAGPKTAPERTRVADAWYKLAKDYKGAEQRRLIDRAWDWYSAALAVAVGDEDLKPGERIKEIEKSYPELFGQEYRGHTGAVAGVIVTPDGKMLVSVANDNSVRLWDVAAGQSVKTLAGHTGWVGSVILTPDGTKAVTAGGDNSIRVWDLNTRQEVKKMEGHTVAIRSLAITGDGTTLISGSSDKTCRAWDLATGKEIRRYGDKSASVESVAVTANGQYVLAGNDVGVVTVFDAGTGKVVSTYTKHESTPVYTIITTPDGKTALSGARDKTIHVWDIATGKELRRLTGHTEQVYQLALSRDGKYIASASYDKTVRIWDFKTGQELKKFEGHTDGVQGTCFTPDGRFVFSASWDKTIRKWRLPFFPPGGGKRVD